MRLKTNRPGADIPTASMADIAFLLIVYFMLTATFAATRGLDFRFSEEPDTVVEVDPVAAVHLRIMADGGLIVDRRPMDLSQVLSYLAPKLAANPGKPVIVQPEPEAPYGRMVAVLDELRHGRERLHLEQDINIALPTERERALLWQ